MLKALKNLMIAMINATLILVVLSLFLAWKVTNKADQIASNFARSLVTVAPIRDDIQAATTELAALRSDFSNIKDQSEELKSASLQRMEASLAQLQTQLETAQQSIAGLSQAPEKLVDHAIDSSTDRMVQAVSDFRGCKPES